jgi:hypothetical protein
MNLFELYEARRIANWKHKTEVGRTLEVIDRLDVPGLLFCVEYTQFTKTYHYRTLKSLVYNYVPNI